MITKRAVETHGTMVQHQNVLFESGSFGEAPDRSILNQHVQQGTATASLFEAQKGGTEVITSPTAVFAEWMTRIAEGFSPLEQQLDRIELETEAWSRDAEQPNEQAFDDARALLYRLKMRGVRPDRVIPSAEGGIGFYFRRGTRYADFECSNSSKVTAVMSDGRGHVEAFDIDMSFEGQKAAIDRVRAFLQA